MYHSRHRRRMGNRQCLFRLDSIHVHRILSSHLSGEKSGGQQNILLLGEWNVVLQRRVHKENQTVLKFERNGNRKGKNHGDAAIHMCKGLPGTQYDLPFNLREVSYRAQTISRGEREGAVSVRSQLGTSRSTQSKV